MGWLCWVDVIVGEIFRWVANHTYTYTSKSLREQQQYHPSVYRARSILVFFLHIHGILTDTYTEANGKIMYNRLELKKQ